MRPNLWEIELRQREAARKAAEEATEQAAKRLVERSCAACGVFGASFGFGVFRNRSDGMWSCADPGCRAIVEARVAKPLAAPPDLPTQKQDSISGNFVHLSAHAHAGFEANSRIRGDSRDPAIQPADTTRHTA